MVCHCYRDENEIIRIISARKATKMKEMNMKGENKMREEYDFSNAVKNPYKRNKINITIRLDEDVLDYFKSLSVDLDIPYQTLINSFLKDCAKNKRQLAWEQRV